MKSPEEKYMQDPEYHLLVDMLENFIHRNQYTPSEIREAAMFACIRYEMRKPMPTAYLKFNSAEECQENLERINNIISKGKRNETNR